MCRLLMLTFLLLPGLAIAALPLDRIRLPEGFRITLLSDQVANAREMVWGERGTLFVGSNAAGKVYALEPSSGKVRTVASGLQLPVGVAYKEGDLYVSAVSRILRLRDIESRLDAPPKPEVVYADLPRETHHGWKFIAFGPDGKLYVPVGAPCNVCNENPDLYAAIHRMNADGSDMELVARGVRNTVGFDWHPQTGELWFSDNGRDLMGDDVPDCELNRLEKAGQHFGFPFCHAGEVPDPEFSQRPCSKFVSPVAKLGPHVAPLGLRFYTGSQFPAEYRNNLFIAEHGSWNRSEKIGYRIKRVELNPDGSLKRQSVFAEGWLEDGEVWGRPADVLVTPDGALLVSDDHAGAIYRIDYVGN
ncbi:MULTISPECIES: sorbosone dehydrogenase family protein [Pseudomonas]|uniref:PQQ-dependent sugar dehydrogenase n=1 Tax=Pseudomonadaceae TaxID=135621 RepID=UPI0010F75AC6|nr:MULTISPECIES: sorbosone dehydrogenase family protein [Pseudomonas]MDE3739228.1 sorbosone dehydrogenase family protein [Pseudomonas resinovorans]